MKSGFTILTVSQLNYYVRSLLESDAKLNAVFLRGEISNFKNNIRSGHYYLTLKDEDAAVRAVMFRGNARRLRFLPQDGMKVIVSGRVSLYERGGEYQFYIDDMQPDGVGALHVAFEQLKEKLRKEGLFDETRKRPLPPFPECVGVVTSPTGAALQDILRILKRRWPLARVLLAPVPVQGTEVPGQICRAVERMNEAGRADVLIVGRGGGSIEDLWAFNDENVARCVAASAIPVVSAVGHETDFTLADFAADVRAPTPSAAAELVSPEQGAVKAALLDASSRLRENLVERFRQGQDRLARAEKALRPPKNQLDLCRMRADKAASRLFAAAKSQVETARGRLSAQAGRLSALDPLRVLARGYAVGEKEGQAVADLSEISPGDTLTVRLTGGRADCRVERVYPDKLKQAGETA